MNELKAPQHIDIIPPSPSVRARAEEVRDRLVQIYTATQRDFIEMGMLIKEADDSKLWAELRDSNGEPYTSLRQWLRAELAYGRSSAYEAFSVVKAMPGIEPEVLKSIPRRNLKLLKKLPAPQRKSKTWIDRAVSMSEIELSEKIHLTLPAGVNSQRLPMRFAFTRKQHRTVGKALLKMAETLDVTGQPESTKEQQLYEICEAFLQGRGTLRKAG